MKFQRKIYLSRAQTRAMAMDHPIGDPTGGPAYGERNDPVSAVVSVATMYLSYEAAFVAGSVCAGMMFAGAAMNLVGNASGNKNLQMLGTVVGLAGGVGSLANLGEASASSVSSSSIDAANASKDPIASLNESQGWTSTAGADTGAAASTAANTTSASSNIVGDANPNVTVNTAPQTTVEAPTPLADTSAVTATNAATTAPTSENLITGNADKAALYGNAGYGETMPSAEITGYDKAVAASGGPNGVNNMGSGSWLPEWGKMSTMDKLIATKIGSDVVGGVTNYIAPSPQAKAATDQANANAQLATAQSDKIKADEALRQQRLANLNRNMQMGLGIGSNQGAVAVNAPQPGLIQSQMRVA
jgi:hypothetical protein